MLGTVVLNASVRGTNFTLDPVDVVIVTPVGQMTT